MIVRRRGMMAEECRAECVAVLRSSRGAHDITTEGFWRSKKKTKKRPGMGPPERANVPYWNQQSCSHYTIMPPRCFEPQHHAARAPRAERGAPYTAQQHTKRGVAGVRCCVLLGLFFCVSAVCCVAPLPPLLACVYAAPMMCATWFRPIPPLRIAALCTHRRCWRALCAVCVCVCVAAVCVCVGVCVCVSLLPKRHNTAAQPRHLFVPALFLFVTQTDVWPAAPWSRTAWDCSLKRDVYPSQGGIQTWDR